MTASGPRATRAREILDSCRVGLSIVRKDPTGHYWLVQWAGTLSLLRTVGDALHKVDARANAKFKAAQDEWWRRIESCQPPIFYCFIKQDRDLLLHKAKLTTGQSTIITLPGAGAMALAAGQPNPPPKLSPPLPAASHSYHMITGTYAGRDPRDLIEEAIAWWEQQIESIEQDAAGR